MSKFIKAFLFASLLVSSFAVKSIIGVELFFFIVFVKDNPLSPGIIISNTSMSNFNTSNFFFASKASFADVTKKLFSSSRNSEKDFIYLKKPTWLIGQNLK